MKTKLFISLIAIAGITSGFAQRKINDQFPVGHYQFSVSGYKLYLNFFDNLRISFGGETGNKEDKNSNFEFTGNYFIDKDTIRITSDDKNKLIHLFYKKNTAIEKGKIQLHSLGEKTDENLYLGRISLAIGKNIRHEDFKSWEDIVSESASDSITLDFQPGDTLIFRTGDLYNSHKSFDYYFLLPSEANDISVRISVNLLGLEPELISMIKGETDNEIKVSFSEKDTIGMYYTGPSTNLDYNEDSSEVPTLPGYTHLKAEKTIRSMLKIEDTTDAGSILDPADAQYDDLEPIEYYTSYETALKAAKKENKLLRVYVSETGSCDSEDPLKAIQSINSANYYSLKYFVQQLTPIYTICILSSNDKQLIKQFGLDSLPARLILTKNEQLLHKEVGCPDPENDYATFSFLPERDTYYGVKDLYTSLMTNYTQNVIAPKINKAKNPDKKLLKEYIDNIFSMAKGNGYMDSWKTICQRIDELKSENRIPDQFSTVSCIHSDEIGKYIDQYVGLHINLPYDQSVAEIALLYYQYIFGYENYLQKLPVSLAYLIKNSGELTKIDNPLIYYKEMDVSKEIMQNLLSPYSYSYSFMETAETTETSEIERIMTAKMLGEKSLILIQEIYKLYPTEEQKDMCVYDYYQFLTNFSINFADNPQLVNFFDEYIQKINIDKKISSDNGEGGANWAEILNTMAWASYKSNNQSEVEKALAWSKKSVEISPENYNYQDTYAHLLYIKGDYESAMKYQKMALDGVSQAENKESLIYREIKVEYELMKLKLLNK